MCDDFFDDQFEDDIFDPSDDYEEDIAEDANGDWYEDGDNLFDGSDAKTSVAPDNKSDSFDLADAMLLGMIGGAFYDAATEDKQRLKRANSKDKNKK